MTVDVHRAAALAAEARPRARPNPTWPWRTSGPRSSWSRASPWPTRWPGYAWWEAEGHGGRIAAVLVDAACTLAALATARGTASSPGGALDRARLVAPYSEALSRAAMRTAAAEGDAERLRPNGASASAWSTPWTRAARPSPRTESLYGELSRAVAGGSRARPTHPVGRD